MESTLFISVTQYVIVGAIILLSQFVYAAVGFGAGLFSVSLLALVVEDIRPFIPFLCLLCLPTEIFVVWRERRRIHFRHTASLLYSLVPCLALACWLLKISEGEILKIVLGTVIFILSCYYLFYENRISLNISGIKWDIAIGSCSGLLAGLFGIGGPPLIFYFKAHKMDKATFRVALLGIFMVISFFRLALYGFLDFFNIPLLCSVVATLPFSFAGMAIGYLTFRYIPEKIFRPLTSAILLLSGLMLVLKNI